MPSRETRTLIGATFAVGASTIAIPYATGYGTILFQWVVLGAWGVVARTTSGRYADTHRPVVYFFALLLNSIFFLIPATGIWLAARNRWPTWCSVTIFGWCVFYVLSFFWLFPATDGP
jgi:hypothetical protein